MSDGYYEEAGEGSIIPESSRPRSGALIGVGPELRGLPRTPLLGTWVNKQVWLRGSAARVYAFPYKGKVRTALGQAGKEEPMPTLESRQEEKEVHLRQKLIFDGFDDAAKGLAAGTISRRRALKVTGSALLGGGLLALFPGVAGAQVSVQSACENRRAISNRSCHARNCGGRSNCSCAKTVSGTKRCVNFRDARCPARDQCDRDRDCARGEVCIQVGCPCGNPRRNLCIPKCS